MKAENLRRYKLNSNILSGIFHKNPLLVLGLGLTFAVAAATELKHAAAISIAIYFTLVPTAIISSLLPKSMFSYIKNIILVLIAAAALLLASYPISSIDPAIFDSLGMYFPILTANSLVVSKYIQHGVVGRPFVAFTDATKSAVGYSLALLAISAVREYFGAGTLWGVDADAVFVMPALLLPFMGFIIVGFFAAFFRQFDRLIRRQIYLSSKK